MKKIIFSTYVSSVTGMDESWILNKLGKIFSREMNRHVERFYVVAMRCQLELSYVCLSTTARKVFMVNCSCE
jgi:hypothetical protein